MSLTRLDCYLFRGDRAAHDVSSFVALNPGSQPSRLVFAGASAVRDSIGSQVAYKLALEHFVKGVEQSYLNVSEGGPVAKEGDDRIVTVLEEAFRSANASVYSFGHQLSAGGRMAATLLGVAVEHGRLATGRVGFGSVYLFRQGQLYPFFETPDGEGERIGDSSEFPDDLNSRRGAFVGSNALIDVEMASVELQASDIICAFSRPLTNLNETLLFEALENIFGGAEGPPGGVEVAQRLCQEVFTEPETLSFCMVAMVGPEAVYLRSEWSGEPGAKFG